MKVGERITEYRRKAGLTQAQLAEKLDISRQSIQKWESGVCNPELDNLIRLCSIFEVTLDDLVGTGVETKNTPIFKEDIVEYETFASKPPIDYRKCDTISLILAVAHFASIITTYAIFGGIEGMFGGFGFCFIAIIAYSVIRSKRPRKSAPYVIISIVWLMAVSGGLSYRNFWLGLGIGFLITLPYSISLFLLHHPDATADPRSTTRQTYRSGTQDTSRPYLHDASGSTAKSVNDPSIRKSQILTAEGYVDLAKHHLSNGARKAAMRELEDCLTYYPRHAPAILSLLLARANCQNEEALFRSRYNVSGDPLWERLLQNETPERVEYLKQAEANRLAFVAQQDAYAAEVARKNALLAEEARRENLYRNALESVRYQDYKGAIRCLERIAPYRDSEKLIQEYRYLLAVLRPNKFHRISTYEKHAALLRELGDYKDSATLAQVYETEIQRKKEAQKKRRKRFKIGMFVTAGAALVITGATFLTKDVIVPNLSYSQAQSLWEQGRYEEAAERFSSFGSYKDAETMVRLSKAGACFKKNDYQEGIKIICEAGGKVAMKYDPNGGTCRQSTETLNKGNVLVTNKASRNGYSFLGWDIKDFHWVDRDCELSLAAKWNLDQYSLSVDLNGGRFKRSTSLPRSYNVESEDIVIPDPVRFGYTFLGWTSSAYGGAYQKGIRIPSGTVGSRSYVAHWAAIENTITLDGNGAVLEQNAITAVYDQPLTLPTPERAGYHFDGWLLDGEIFPSGKTWTKIVDSTLTASWTPIQYVISYDLAGGSSSEKERLPETYTVESEEIVIPEPVRKGYTFLGWTGSNGDVPEKEVMISPGTMEAFSFRANWEAKQHIINLDPLGGTVSESTVNVTFGEPLELPIPTREGYRFGGWVLDGNVALFEDIWDMDHPATLIAKWVPLEYGLSYDLAGGTFQEGAMPPEKYTIESESFVLPQPVKKGNTFIGWTGSNGDEPQIDPVVKTGTKGDLAFVANWEANHYAVDLDSNGGSVSGSAVDATYGESLELPAPERKGYRFGGWVLDGGIFSSGDIWDKDCDATLTAKWIPVEYQISFDLVGGNSPEELPGEYTIETETFGVPNPVRKGYTFIGWTGSNGNVPQTDLAVSIGTTGDLSFAANWEANHYAVDLDATGGTVSESAVDATFGEPLELPAPTKEGYRFAGWELDGKPFVSGNTWNEDRDTVLKAKWTLLQYHVTYDLAGGSFAEGEVLPKTYTVESKTFSIPDPTREGFTFLGWTGSNGDVPQTGIAVASGTTGSLSFLANWKANEYALTVKNGGALDDLATKFMAGEPISEPSQYKSLYCCEEYYSDAEMTRPVEWPLVAYGDVSVYAKWTQTISSLYLSYAYEYQNYLTFDGDEIAFHVYGITSNNMDWLHIHSNVSGTVTFAVSATNNPIVFYGIREQDPAYSYKLQGNLREDPKEISFQVEENKDYVILFQDAFPLNKSDIVIKGLVLSPYKQVLFRDGETGLGARYLAKGETLDLDAISLSQIGREFKGFYFDESLTQKAEGEIVVKTDMVLYTEWDVLFDIDFGGWVYESVGSFGYAYHSAKGKVDSITITFAKAGTLSLEIYPIYSQQSVSVYDPDTGKKYLGATCGMTFLGDWVSGKFAVEAGQTIIIKTVPKDSYGDALMRNLEFVPRK